jgi:hypothetical protein
MKKTHAGTIMDQDLCEASERIWEASETHLGAIWEVSGRHLAGILVASLGHLGGSWGEVVDRSGRQ